jgi:insulysin
MVSKCGGTKNAATGEDYTYYFFDVMNKHLDEVLEVFSDFFKGPLFTESGVDREINAVDSEFKKNLSNEDRRTRQILKNIVANEKSAFNGFGTGNLETLKKQTTDDLQKLLRTYYDEHYSANLMTLSICGDHSLDELQQMAVKHFQNIEDKQLVLQDFSADDLFKSRTGAWVKIVTVKDLKMLKLLWPNLPRDTEFYKTSPLGYISHVLGHEGENSLLSELIRKDLATSCDSSSIHYL